jgi:2-polyprenyl-6-methoxyphenol hydroxylase-like FAD-dependent oxidoreductase
LRPILADSGASSYDLLIFMADFGVPRFTVIIVGGSLVGLTTAVALEKAGINYVLLEKGEIAPHLGASISIHPHTQRVMEQLGVWPEIEAGAVPLGIRQHYDRKGKLFEDSAILQEISNMRVWMLLCL